MERGVVVGGLMICGSFLLAASLNRSAVKETPVAEPPAVPAPVAPAAAEIEPVPCKTDASASNEAVEAENKGQSDLPGNGREACTQ